MATYYHYFRAGGHFLVLIIVLVVFLMGEVCVGGRRRRVGRGEEGERNGGLGEWRGRCSGRRQREGGVGEVAPYCWVQPGYKAIEVEREEKK